MEDLAHEDLVELFRAVGEHLAADSVRVAIVVVGGASLITRGWVRRATKDVDVIAILDPETKASPKLIPPDPLPRSLQEAGLRVARDYDLPPDWLNAEVGAQWRTGLPADLTEDLEWWTFGGLDVAFAGRQTIIALKLYAAVDRGPESVHVQDLVTLRPTADELERARQWVLTQDASPVFSDFIDQVIDHVTAAISTDR